MRHPPRSSWSLATLLVLLAGSTAAHPRSAPTSSSTSTSTSALAPALDTPWPHDVHRPLPLPHPKANDVRALALGPNHTTLWAATAGGLFRLEAPTTQDSWQEIPAPDAPSFGPCLSIAAAGPQVWLGAWNGLHLLTGSRTVRIPDVPGPVTALALDHSHQRLLAGGPHGFFLVRNDVVQVLPLPTTRYLGRMLAGTNDDWWIATGMGVYHWTGKDGRYLRGPFTDASLACRDLLLDDTQRLWVATLGGIQMFQGHRLQTTLAPPATALPSSDVRCLALDPDGRLWAGTDGGLARHDRNTWTVRRGRRWLLHDDVRDLRFSPDRTAWIATAGGVSALTVSHLSMAAKASHFQAVLEARHVRPPGIVEKCRFDAPGRLESWKPTDDDNDGGYTALAMAMECYRYAVTRDPAALAAARRGMATCELLERVTRNPGFIARTVVPAHWNEVHDPNQVLAPEAQAEELARDPRNKYVPVRWRPSADGQWLWKGDTSSDEVTAHFFGYFVYHQLLEDPADRARVRDQITRIVDHLLAQGLVLRDLDGQPTRWGIWAPEFLNHDPNWEMERGINSLEILSFLKLAAHVSGDARYEREYHRLLREHHYDRNLAQVPNLNPAWRTYIDFELLALAFPALLALETDPALLRLYRSCFERWHNTIRADGNPLFEFLYARFASPRKANLRGALAFLRDTPLDLVRWDIDNRSREDVPVHRAPEVEHWQTRRLLPASEIGYSRTDQNPWRAQQGEAGMTESDGVFWLLPYWMGRQQGLLR